MTQHHTPLRGAAAALAIAAVALVPTIAAAQTSPAGDWKFAASINLYLPSVGGSSSFPVDSIGNPIDVSSNQIIDNLKMTFMGSLGAHNGQWGAFTDILYLNLGNTKSQSRDFTIGNIGLPGGVTADLGWDIKGTIWTTAGEYRLASDPAGLTIDALAGVRLFNMRQELNWALSADIPPIINSANRAGSAAASEHLWDGIVGLKGRMALGSARAWSLPFYADVGAGNSKLTYQLAGGISYGFNWGELSAMWRYVGYDLKSGNVLQSINFNGPMVSATWRW